MNKNKVNMCVVCTVIFRCITSRGIQKKVRDIEFHINGTYILM
jgi:hypothetical protein